jgi:hypothetical protein
MLWSGEEMVAVRCQIRVLCRKFKVSTGSAAGLFQFYFTAIKFLAISLKNIVLRLWLLKTLLTV